MDLCNRYMKYEDNFSKQAATYARHRPGYPDALFAYLASVAPSRHLAWDCATGNGQAALDLARHFAHVIATDASAQQIDQAPSRKNVEFRVAMAEASGLDAGSVDLVTVATAIHWLDLEQFYAEVKRVLAPGGILAVWSYFRTEIDPEVSRVLAHYTKDVVGPYWSPRIRLVQEEYRSIPFPFQELHPPEFNALAEWTLDDLIGFMKSWSSTQAFIDARGYDPISEVIDDLRRVWGDPESHRTVRWPLYLRVGTVAAENL
jgi:ubiquinone/menaquinone biosynthesis C-methylase UbiE